MASLAQVLPRPWHRPVAERPRNLHLDVPIRYSTMHKYPGFMSTAYVCGAAQDEHVEKDRVKKGLKGGRGRSFRALRARMQRNIETTPKLHTGPLGQSRKFSRATRTEN